ncbi:MAG: hypothetical protein JWP38_3066 [Herbaspirillum sp.]|nr:hypothetical protein [Herbaspirillum sp.]
MDVAQNLVRGWIPYCDLFSFGRNFMRNRGLNR